MNLVTKKEIEELKIGLINNSACVSFHESESELYIHKDRASGETIKLTDLIATLEKANEVIENLQNSAYEMYDINKIDIECRADEDCDHCLFLECAREAREYMKEVEG